MIHSRILPDLQDVPLGIESDCWLPSGRFGKVGTWDPSRSHTCAATTSNRFNAEESSVCQEGTGGKRPQISACVASPRAKT